MTEEPTIATAGPDDARFGTPDAPDRADDSGEAVAVPEASGGSALGGGREVWSTGDPRVDEAVARLDQLDERDIDEHADVYDTTQGDLADVLDSADETGVRDV